MVCIRSLLKNVNAACGVSQCRVVAIPKSMHKERVIQNFNVFDFALSANDMEEIAKLDKKESLFFSYYDPKIVGYLVGLGK